MIDKCVLWLVLWIVNAALLGDGAINENRTVYGLGCTTTYPANRGSGRRRGKSRAGGESAERWREAGLAVEALARSFQGAKAYVYV